jgi:hypothetical protein
MFDVSGTKLEELFVKIVAESKAKGAGQDFSSGSLPK